MKITVKMWAIALACVGGAILAVPLSVLYLPVMVWNVWKGLIELYTSTMDVERQKQFERAGNVVSFKVR